MPTDVPTEVKESLAMDLDASTEPGPPASTRELVAAHLRSRQLRFVESPDGTIVVAFHDADRRPLFEVMFAAGAWAGSGLGAVARSGRTIDRSEWPASLAACNGWNRRVRLPKARLEAADWNADRSGEVLLEAWMPIGDHPDDGAIAQFVDGTIVGGTQFWSTSTTAATSTTSLTDTETSG